MLGEDDTAEEFITEKDEIKTAIIQRAEEAGLNNIKNTQVLHFDDNFGNNDIRLIELSTELLETLKEERKFILRGDPDEDVVLCTSNKTYGVKECTTSNSLLLIPDLSTTTESREETDKRSVSCTNFVYLELRLCRAKLDKMRLLLNRSAYSGEEMESSDRGEKVAMRDILNSIQASEEEIRKGLDELGAIELDGFWRVIDHEYKTSAMSRILTLLEEMSWSWEKVPLIECCHTLAELQPRFITELCIRLYSQQLGAGEETEGEVYVKLCPDRICRFYGEYILSSTAGKFNLAEFIEVWQDSLPEGMQCDVGYLRGVGLINKSSRPHTVSYLPASDLPMDPGGRFTYLFSKQDKWDREDIIPYLEDLIGPGLTVNSLLLKHCRSATDPKTKKKIYNSKSRT